MIRISTRCLSFSSVVLSAGFLFAADAAWKAKPIEQWTEEDAKQFLAESPWVKRATPALLPPEDEDERRSNGRMGGATVRRDVNAYSGRMGALMLRWESAFPVRSAELKAHEEGSLDFDGDGYALAIYRVPVVRGPSQTQKGFLAELKARAALRRDGKRDVMPQRVDIVDLGDNFITVVYLFPRTKEITLDDKRVDFYAQIGRLAFKESFYPEVMQLQGKLRL